MYRILKLEAVNNIQNTREYTERGGLLVSNCQCARICRSINKFQQPYKYVI